MLDRGSCPGIGGKRKLRSFIAKVEALHDFWSMIFLCFWVGFWHPKTSFVWVKKTGDCHGITGFFVH